MKRLFTALLATAGVAALTPAVWAGPLTPLNINRPGLTISGNLVSHVSGNQWLMNTGVIGQITIKFNVSGSAYNIGSHVGFNAVQVGQSFANGSTMHALLNAAGGWDNNLFTGAGSNPFDSHGILLEIDGGADKNDYLWLFVSAGKVQSDLFSHSGSLIAQGSYNLFHLYGGVHGLVDTPEPSSLLLLGTGLLLLALILLRKGRRKQAGTAIEIPAKIAA